MAGKSNIEWTGHSWNPLAGCSVLTPGCKRCYAMKMAARLEAMGQQLYAGLTQPSKAGAVWTGVMRQAPEHVLLAPLKRKKPTTYFVNSMSDLFHENVPDQWIDRIFAVMALSPQHTFQILTKRAGRMRDYLHSELMSVRWASIAKAMSDAGVLPKDALFQIKWPLPNVWLGCSTERQQEADERIPLLLQTPAAVRFISAEPLLGPIDLKNIDCGGGIRWNALGGRGRRGGLDWVIVGGESGPGSREFKLEWARQIVGDCRAAGVACFVKQIGAAPTLNDAPYGLQLDRKGGEPGEWPGYLDVREMPQVAA